jgi:hypothetical protein
MTAMIHIASGLTTGVGVTMLRKEKFGVRLGM